MKFSITIECDSAEQAARVLQAAQAAAAGTTPVPTPTVVTPASFGGHLTVVGADLPHLEHVPFISGGVDDTPIRFGKYKNLKTPRDLIDFDPQYLLWCEGNLDYPPASPELMEYVKYTSRGEVPPPKTSAPSMIDSMDDDIPF